MSSEIYNIQGIACDDSDVGFYDVDIDFVDVGIGFDDEFNEKTSSICRFLGLCFYL